jgi:ribonuclease HI
MHAQLFFDGGAKPNPGRAAAGAVLILPDRTIERGCYLGDNVTNNVAEWTGLLIGLWTAAELKLSHLTIRGDSQLVIGQLTLGWDVSNKFMRYHAVARGLLTQFATSDLKHVPRKENALADDLCNRILDGSRPSDFDPERFWSTELLLFTSTAPSPGEHELRELRQALADPMNETIMDELSDIAARIRNEQSIGQDRATVLDRAVRLLSHLLGVEDRIFG